MSSYLHCLRIGIVFWMTKKEQYSNTVPSEEKTLHTSYCGNSVTRSKMSDKSGRKSTWFCPKSSPWLDLRRAKFPSLTARSKKRNYCSVIYQHFKQPLTSVWRCNHVATFQYTRTFFSSLFFSVFLVIIWYNTLPRDGKWWLWRFL